MIIDKTKDFANRQAWMLLLQQIVTFGPPGTEAYLRSGTGFLLPLEVKRAGARPESLVVQPGPEYGGDPSEVRIMYDKGRVETTRDPVDAVRTIHRWLWRGARVDERKGKELDQTLFPRKPFLGRP